MLINDATTIAALLISHQAWAKLLLAWAKTDSDCSSAGSVGPWLVFQLLQVVNGSHSMLTMNGTRF